MINEITAATTFIALHLQKTVPESTRTVFREALATKLTHKFSSHWDPKLPLKGNAFRSLSFHRGRIDSVILEVSSACGLDVSHLEAAFPDNFVIWIDPFSVSYRTGEHGVLVVIWEDHDALMSAGCAPDSASAIADLVNSSSSRLPSSVMVSSPSPIVHHDLASESPPPPPSDSSVPGVKSKCSSSRPSPAPLLVA